MAAHHVWEIIEKAAAAKGLSIKDLVLKSGISRPTFYRWKQGNVCPRLAEFRQVAKAQELASLEENYGIALLAHPQAGDEIAWRLTRLEVCCLGLPAPPDPSVREEESVSWRPGIGDLLQAMQHRAGLTGDETARRIGVSPTRLSRWLRSLSPVPEQELGPLVQALAASEHEAAFLREYKEYRDTCCWAGTATLHEAVEQHIQVNDRQQAGEDILGDLEYLVVENRLWPHALESPGAREVLALSYYNHGMWLKNVGRQNEANEFADRSLRMALNVHGTGKAQRSRWWPHSVIMNASQIAHRNRRLAIETLRQHEDDPMAAQFLEYFHRELAELYSLAGNFILAKRHIEIALNASMDMEERFQNVVKRGYAQILLRDNQFDKALETLPDVSQGSPQHQARCLAIQVQAFRRRGKRYQHEAERSRQQLEVVLSLHPHLRPRIPASVWREEPERG